MLLVNQTRLVLGVDLASRYSAAVLWDAQGGQVVTEFDSVGQDAASWVDLLCGVARGLAKPTVVVEDVPPRIQWAGPVKRVCRLQGRILQALPDTPVWFVPPAIWQRTFEGVWRGKEDGAAAAAERLDYHPPQLVGDPRFEPLGKTPSERKRLAKKVMSDYVDAFLIAHWAASQPDLSAVANIQRGDG